MHSVFSDMLNMRNEHDIKDKANDVASGIVSVLMSLEMVPIVAVEKRVGPAREIGLAVIEQLRALRTKLDLDINHRSVLILANRDLDLLPAVQHCWSYRPLLHDLFGIKNAQVSVPVEGEGIKSFSLDATDKYWLKFQQIPFHEVAGQYVEQGLQDVGEKISTFNRETGLDLSDGDLSVMEDKLQDAEIKLTTNTIDDIFELLEEKKRLTAHMKMSLAVLSQIKSRHLDDFFSLESKLLARRRLTDEEKARVSELLSVPEESEASPDQIRFLLVLFLLFRHAKLSNKLSKFPFSSSDLDVFSSSLFGDDASLLSALDHPFFQSNPLFNVTTPPARSLSSIGSNLMSSFNVLGTSLKSMASSGFSFSSADAARPMLCSRLVNHFLHSNNDDSANHDFSKAFEFLSISSSSVPSSSSTFDHACLFMVGGASFDEYQNLQMCCDQWASDGLMKHKSVVFGSSSFIQGSSFLDVLSSLVSTS